MKGMEEKNTIYSSGKIQIKRTKGKNEMNNDVTQVGEQGLEVTYNFQVFNNLIFFELIS